MSIEDAINLIFSGNCVLFLGAGYSYQAENVMGNGIPMASELSKLLDEKSWENIHGREYIRPTMTMFLNFHP